MAIAVAVWSLKVDQNPVAFTPQSDVRITNIALGHKVEDAKSRTSVRLTYPTPVQIEEDDTDGSEGPEPFTETILCTLIPDKVEHAKVDLILEEDAEYTFEALGNNTVYLTGNYIDQSPPGFPGPFDESSDEDDEEETFDLRAVSSDVEVDPNELVSDDEDRFEEVTEEIEKTAKSLKRPRESDVVEGEGKTLSKAEKKRLKKKLKADGGQAVAASPEARANDGDQKNKNEKDKKKEKMKEKEKDGKGQKKDTPNTAQTKDTKPKELPGGIKVKDMIAGTGPQAKKGNTVSLQYVGKLQSGKVFDKMTKKPFTFRLGQGEVIKGWDEGIVGMQVEGKRILTIPPAMAYGNKQTGDIPPNSTLIFECKLIEIK